MRKAWVPTDNVRRLQAAIARAETRGAAEVSWVIVHGPARPGRGGENRHSRVARR